ncbi:MAG: flagellar motor switch protein FliM [Ignavibacteria bacterium]|nr:flagellar motor switch protein FliM [Ignavibacteria bacterium]
MSEILSQSEINSLLSGPPGSQSSPGEGSATKGDREVHAFDFRLPHRLSKNQLRIFQAVHDSFSETFGTYLVSRLQANVTIEVTSVDQLFYSEYVLSIASPSCLYVCRIGESDALMMMELNPQLVLAIVERLLGGSSEGERASRLITRIEQSIVKGIVQRALVDLQRSWKTISELSFKLERYESEGDFAQIAPTSEIVLVVSLEVMLNEQKFLMNLCFPTFALDSVLTRLNTQHFSSMAAEKPSGEWSKEILSKLGSTSLPAVAILGESTLTLGELLALEPGDILRTNIPVNGEVKVTIGEKPRLWGRPGVSGGKTAIKVTRISTGSELGE